MRLRRPLSLYVITLAGIVASFGAAACAADSSNNAATGAEEDNATGSDKTETDESESKSEPKAKTDTKQKAESTDGGLVEETGPKEPDQPDASTPPDEPKTCEGDPETEPNDDPRGRYSDLSTTVCGKIAGVDVDHFVFKGTKGQDVTVVVEASAPVQLSVWTVQGPILTKTDRTIRETFKLPTGEGYLRLSNSKAAQSYTLKIDK